MGKKRKFILGCVYAVLLAGLLGTGVIGYWQDTRHKPQHKREDTDFHLLTAESHIVEEPPKQIEIDDKSTYAEDDGLELYQYTCRYYDQDMLVAEVTYDKEGSLLNINSWEYDTAGNIRRELADHETDGLRTRSHAYEYDGSGRVVHEAIYWDGKLIEDNYLRYTDVGRTGVSYSYLNEQIDGGISEYCYSHTEFLDDIDGNPLCIFYLPSLEMDIPNQVWKMQWAEYDGLLVNRVQYYDRNISFSSQRNWYQDIGRAHGEQVNLYEYGSGTAAKNQILQLNYEWQSELSVYGLTDSFYRARYDGELLMWQMSYSNGELVYYSACQYDTDGRLQAMVEYVMEEGESYAGFHRYEYPDKDKEEQYSYYIQGKAFCHSFGDRDNVLLTFDDEGFISEIEMTDAAGNVSEKYEFYVSGENYGRLQKMYAGTDEISGEDAILEKMEDEAEAYGFRAGKDLVNETKGNVE